MSDSTKKMRPSEKLGYSKPETDGIVDALNKLLANYHVHYQKLRNFHWNVVGPDFFDLHEIFEQDYNKAKKSIDVIAERIRIFGRRPLSNLSEYLETSSIEEVDSRGMSGNEMAREIVSDYETLLSFLVDTADEANQVGDIGTSDMATKFARYIEKRHWMLRAFLAEEGETPEDK